MRKLTEQCRRWLSSLKAHGGSKQLLAVVILGLSGIVALAVSGFLDSKEQTEAQTAVTPAAADKATLEAELEDLLGQIEGVGRVRVMVTMENNGEQVMARNSESSGENDEAGKSWKENSEYAVVNGKTVLLKTTEPTVRGVAVVCEGGDSPRVKERVSTTVTAVLGIRSNRVSVVCMERENG